MLLTPVESQRVQSLLRRVVANLQHETHLDELQGKAVEQNTGTDKKRAVGAVTEPEAGTSRKQCSHGINRSNTQRSPPRRLERATKNRMLWFCTVL